MLPLPDSPVSTKTLLKYGTEISFGPPTFTIIISVVGENLLPLPDMEIENFERIYCNDMNIAYHNLLRFT